MAPNTTNFRYLNRDAAWRDFHWDGLELRADGALQLLSLPRLSGGTPGGLSSLPVPTGPAGIAVGANGDIFYSDPDGNRVYEIHGCDGSISAASCMGGPGDAGGQFRTPRGLLISPRRRALYVADAGNHRVQVFDRATGQLLDVWEGTFSEPWSLAADADGNVYVADYGNRTVEKFAISGDPDPSFWNNVQSSGLITRPAAVAVASDVFILDLSANRIFVFHTDGTPVLDATDAPLSIGWTGMLQPMGLAADASHVYVGDNGLRAVLQFNRSSDRFEFAGEAGGFEGPVAALALDGEGGLLVHTGGATAPLRLTIGASYSSRGTLWSKAIDPGVFQPVWHEVEAAVAASSPEAHVQFFVRTSDSTTPPPVFPKAPDPFPVPGWRPIGLDIADFFLGGPPAKFFWIAAVLTGDLRSTPMVSQIRVEFNHESYLEHLPEIYREPSPAGDFLLRFLSLFESFFEEPEDVVLDLPALFDPQAIRAEYLPWLAGWLALDLPPDASEAARRANIAAAYERYAKRGTVSGLREALLRDAGVHAVIEEPILDAGWWRLPSVSTACNADTGGQTVWRDGADSVLGFTTGLASSQPQGAVLGTSTVLDQSHLISADDYAEPLFEDLAYRFSVLVYPGEVQCAAKLNQVLAVLESEKPAHTAYHLCVVEPRLRVGFQARLGIETLLGGPPLPTRLGDAELVLGGEPAAVIGMDFVGQDAYL